MATIKHHDIERLVHQVIRTMADRRDAQGLLINPGPLTNRRIDRVRMKVTALIRSEFPDERLDVTDAPIEFRSQ